MRANVSQVNSWLSCPRRWYYRHAAGRVPDEPESPALALGSQWHALVERATSPGEALALVEDLAGSELMPPLFVSGLRAWADWLRASPIEFCGTELALEAPLGHRHTLYGRLDALVRWNARYWHLQHKTLGVSTPLRVFSRAQSRAYHEYAYRLLGEHAGHEPWAGTVLVTLRKLSLKALERGENPLNVEFLCLLRRPCEVHRELCVLFDQMESGLSDPAEIRQNPLACDGWFHNKLCGYIDVCDEISPLDALPLAKDKPAAPPSFSLTAPAPQVDWESTGHDLVTDRGETP